MANVKNNSGSPRRKHKPHGKGIIIAVTVIIVLALIGFFLYEYFFDKGYEHKSGTLAMHAVDTGQGDSVILQFPDGKNMIIDAGSGTNASSAAVNKVLGYIKDLKITRFDYLMLTHTDADHCNILDDVINAEGVSVGKIFMPRVKSSSAKDPLKEDGNAHEVNTAAYRNFVDAAVNSGAEIAYTLNGKIIAEAEYFAEVFSLPDLGCYDFKSLTGSESVKINSVSPIMTVEFAGRRVMLTGDSNEINEPRFIALIEKNGWQSKVKSDILKVAHHGSQYATQTEFLNLVRPEYAVICVGAGNGYGHPTSEVLGRLAASNVKVYRTDLNGNVVFTVTAEQISVKVDKGEVTVRVEFLLAFWVYRGSGRATV